MKILLNKKLYALFISLLLITSATSAELENFSWYQTAVGAGDTNSEFRFNYDIVTSSPNMIFYASSHGIDTSLLGPTLEPSKVSVTINGEPAEINFETSYNNGYALLIRLQDPTVAASGDSIEVILKDVKNNPNPGNYPWYFIRTGDSGARPLDEVTNPREIELWGYELNNFSWHNTSSEVDATNVSYVFNYRLVNSSPSLLLYAYMNGFWTEDKYEYPVDFTGGGQILDDNKVSVTINGAPANIAFESSWIGEGNVAIRLSDHSLAQAGDNIEVTVNGVTNKGNSGSFSWDFISTAHGSGQAMDKVTDPQPVVLTDTTAAISVDAVSTDSLVPSTGGRLYFSRTITNETSDPQTVQKWAYITWPNGYSYNREKVKNYDFSALEVKSTSRAYFDVPAYWPAGEYEYHINTLTIPLIEQSTVSFTFIKE